MIYLFGATSCCSAVPHGDMMAGVAPWTRARGAGYYLMWGCGVWGRTVGGGEGFGVLRHGHV